MKKIVEAIMKLNFRVKFSNTVVNIYFLVYILKAGISLGSSFQVILNAPFMTILEKFWNRECFVMYSFTSDPKKKKSSVMSL